MVSTAQGHRVHQVMTLREEVVGRKLFNGGTGSGNLKSSAKMQHFQNLSLWASSDAALPSMGALFGRHFATCQEAAGVPRDPSLFQCQRCECILQPGCNCTVRIQKRGGNMRRQRKKSNTTTKNNVIYTCDFCSHRNQIRGTPRGHVKGLVASKQQAVSELEPIRSMDQASMVSKTGNISKKAGETVSSKDITFSKSQGFVVDPDPVDVICDENSPLDRVRTLLSEGKRRKRKGSGGKSSDTTEDKMAVLDAGSGGSSRKRKKYWSSLREIAENSEKEKRQFLTSLKVPFFL